MAKPIVELLTELQKAVDKAEKDGTASTAAAAAYQKRHEAAQQAFEKEEAAARAARDKASQAFQDSAGYVETLQAEVNSVLGTFTNKSRVTISK